MEGSRCLRGSFFLFVKLFVCMSWFLGVISIVKIIWGFFFRLEFLGSFFMRFIFF